MYTFGLPRLRCGQVGRSALAEIHTRGRHEFPVAFAADIRTLYRLAQWCMYTNSAVQGPFGSSYAVSQFFRASDDRVHDRLRYRQ